MDYLLGVLYATKKYEFLDTSCLQQSTATPPQFNVSNGGPTFTSAAGSGDGDANEDSGRERTIPANFARRTTARPFSTSAIGPANIAAEDSLKHTETVDAGAGSLFPGGDCDDGSVRRLSVASGIPRDPRRLSSSLRESGMGASCSAFSPPREVGALSPILPGLSVSTAAIVSATAVVAGNANEDSAAGPSATIARPQRLEYSVPTKMLAGKYVLVYLPAPHGSNTAGQVSQLWGGSSAGVSNAASGAYVGGVGVRGAGPPSGSVLHPSPQVEPLKTRLCDSASSLLPGVSPHTIPQGSGAGRPNFTSALSKSAGPLGSSASLNSYSHGLSTAATAPATAPNRPLPVAVVHAAAAAATTHQKLLIFYCLLLRRLANQSASEKPPANVLDDEEGRTVTTTQVPVAVLELHYITEGPLRNNVFGPANTSGSGSGQGSSDGHSGTTSSASPSSGVGAADAGGGGGGVGGSGSYGHNSSPASSLSSFVHPAPYGGNTGGGGGRNSCGHYVTAANSGGTANVMAGGGGFSSTTTSAMASPRLQFPGLNSSSAGDFSPRLDGCVTGEDGAAAAATLSLPESAMPIHLLSTILLHLQEGKPDKWLSPDNVVFDRDVTQNPYYGGWYSVESNDGYRRVLQLYGIEAWPAVILIDPAGNLVTASALQHVEEELAQFTAEVELSVAKAAAARATALAEAVETQILSPTGSPLPPPPILQEVEGQGAQGAMSSPSPSSSPAVKEEEEAVVKCVVDEEQNNSDEDVLSPAPSTPPHTPYGFGNDASATNSSRTVSSNQVARDAATGKNDDNDNSNKDTIGKGVSVSDRSCTNLIVATVEGPNLYPKTRGTETCTPNRLNDSKSTSADLREPSIPFDDPQIPTAEPTPVKQTPPTARYCDDSAVRAIPLSDEMTSPLHDDIGDRTSISTQEYCSPCTAPQNGSIAMGLTTATTAMTTTTLSTRSPNPAPPIVEGVSVTDKELMLKKIKSFIKAPGSERAKPQNTNWATERREAEEERDATHEKSASLSAWPTSRLSMLNLQDGRAVDSMSASSYSPSVVSMTKGYVSLPSWSLKAYSRDVAGVIAMRDIDSEAVTLLHAASQSPFGAGDPQTQTRQQQQHQSCPCNDSPARGAAVAGAEMNNKSSCAGPAAEDVPDASSLQHSTFCGGSSIQRDGNSGASTSKVSRDFMATASGVSGLPPMSVLLLPAFTSRFPWTSVMPEPILTYSTQTLLKQKEEGDDEGDLDNVQKTSRRHLQERVEQQRHRTSAVARAINSKSSVNPSTTNRDDTGDAKASKAAAAVQDLGLSSGSNNTGSGQTNTTFNSTHPAMSGPCSLSAAATTPAVMVLRKSTPCGPSRRSGNNNNENWLDGGESPAIASGDSAARTQTPLVRLSTAQLELTTFAETSPLIAKPRCWPLHPLRRLAMCSITVDEVVKRTRNTTNNPHFFASPDNDTRTEQGAAPDAGSATNGVNGTVATASAVLCASSNSAAMLSLSIGDSTDDDGNNIRSSRSPSPASHIARQCVPRLQLSLENSQQQQKTTSAPLGGWLQDAATKFESSTHLLLLFGAGWHPGMSKCVKALRRLQESVNSRSFLSSGRSAKRVGGIGDGGLVDGAFGCDGGGMAGKDSFNTEHDGNGDVDDGLFPTKNSFNTKSVDWPSGGPDGNNDNNITNAEFGGLGGGGGRLSKRGLDNYNINVGEPNEDKDGSSLLWRASFQRGRIQGASPSGVLAADPPTGDDDAAIAERPRYRIQVIYISADESTQEVCETVSAMPPLWLCLSPHIAQSSTERQLQQRVCDDARRIFRVTSFPRVVVVELPTAQQAQKTSNMNGATQKGSVASERSDAGTPGNSGGGGGEDADDNVISTSTTTTMDNTQLQRAEQRFEGLWTVVQLHGETQLNADPDGTQFPWSYSQDDVLRITQGEISALPREGQRAWSYLRSGSRQQPLQQQQQQQQTNNTEKHPTSLQQSPMLVCSNPDVDVEAPSLTRSHPDLLVTVDRGDESSPVAGEPSSITRAPSPPLMPVARMFPPLKPFVVGDGELPMLLEKGGYFVVLSAFGSIDAQLHQQCVSALEEARTWLYAEVETRKEQAWLEPTRLQVVAPHSAYATSFTVGGDRAVLSPAVLPTLNEEYGTPTRYSSGISASALATLQGTGTGSGAASMAAALRMLHGGTSGSGNNVNGKNGNNSGMRGGAPLLPDEGCSEGRTSLNTSPKFTLINSPLNGGPGGLLLDSTASALNLQLSHSSVGTSAAGGGGGANKASASPRPLPTVFFYDSIITNPHNARTQNNKAADTSPSATVPMAAAAAAAAPGVMNGRDGLMQVSTAPWGNASPTPAPATFVTAAARIDSPTPAASVDVPTTAVIAASPSPFLVSQVSDNTASLRRHHTKDLALLQEYVIAPILENDERMLPAREGEVYLALVRWPQRTAAVLRRRLASEVKVPGTVGGVGASATVSVASTAAGGVSSSTVSACGGGASVPSSVTVSSSSNSSPGGSSTSRSATSTSQSPGQLQLLPEVLQRRQPVLPSPLFPSTGVAATGTSAGTSNHLGTQTVPVCPVGMTSTSASNTEHNSPPLASITTYTPATTSLSATILTEESGKEGSLDPEANPLASVDVIKSFLYEQILRSMAI